MTFETVTKNILFIVSFVFYATDENLYIKATDGNLYIKATDGNLYIKATDGPLYTKSLSIKAPSIYQIHVYK
jgi:DNA polymerase III sliding clamp (beta) subunit (PCNA family)